MSLEDYEIKIRPMQLRYINRQLRPPERAQGLIAGVHGGKHEEQKHHAPESPASFISCIPQHGIPFPATACSR